MCPRCKCSGITAWLGPFGTHQASCISTRGLITRKHTTTQRAAIACARECETPYLHEPPTSEVLNHTQPQDLCNVMFTKRSNAQSRRRGLEIHQLLISLRSPDLTDVQRTDIKIKLDSLLLDSPTDGKGLRLDALISGSSSSSDLLIDFLVQHPEATSHVALNDAWFMSELAAEQSSLLTGSPNPMALTPSASLSKASTAKRTKYSLLTAIANVLHQTGQRPRAAEFLPVALSHSGEFGPGVFALVERFVSDARHAPSLSPSSTGLSSKETSAHVRKRVKDAFACAVAAGFGRVLTAAGNVWT